MKRKTLTLKKMKPKSGKENKDMQASILKTTSSQEKIFPRQSLRKGPLLFWSDLVTYAAVRHGLPKSVINKSLEALLEAIEESLGQGGEVRLPGFGSFYVRNTSLRKAYNISTGEKMEIPAMRRPGFRPATALKDRVK